MYAKFLLLITLVAVASKTEAAPTPGWLKGLVGTGLVLGAGAGGYYYGKHRGAEEVIRAQN